MKALLQGSCAWPALAALTFLQVPQAPTAAAPRRPVELPAGPAGRAFAGVGRETRAASLPAGPSTGLDAASWRTTEPWRAWADAVRAEAAAPEPDAQRRAALARIALAQNRWDDAWEHFAATGAEPTICAALLPQFLPGVQAPAGPGGIVGALPNGVLLRPAVPPPAVAAAEVSLGRTWIERREMRLEGLHIGGATLSMRVGLESDGIQVEFEHRGGVAAHVRVVLPELADFEVRVAYVDWMRQDEVGGVLELDIAPGDEPHTLFGRFRPRAISWPTNLPEGSPRFLQENGLELCFPGTAPDASLFSSASAGMASVLGLPVTTREVGSVQFAGVKVDLTDPAVARRKFLGLITLSERFALRRPRR